MDPKQPTIKPEVLAAWRKIDAEANAEQSRREYELREAWKQQAVARLAQGESLDKILANGVPLYLFTRKPGRRAIPRQAGKTGRPAKYSAALLDALTVLVPALRSACPGTNTRDVIRELLVVLAEDVGCDPAELGDVRGLENALRYRLATKS